MPSTNRPKSRRLARAFRYRLIVPLMRSRHAPEYSARGAAVGLAWAFTPFVGLHMLLVFLTWLIARRLFRWDFSLVLGLAWTWAINVFTLVPCYYLVYVTGQLLLGHWRDLSGYRRFLADWSLAFAPGAGLVAEVKAMLGLLLRDWGVVLLVGALPWSALMAWLGYHYSLKLILAYRQRRHRPPA